MKRFVLVSAVLSFACSHRTIPGTSIPDDEQTRAVLDVFGKYKSAFEARDANGILKLVAPTYFDATDPAHPVDYEALKRNLPHEFDNVPAVKLDVTVKDVEVRGQEARVDYYAVERYDVKTPVNEKWKSSSDDARMRFAKVNGEWKITWGL